MKGTGRPRRQPARVFAAGPEVVHARCAPPSLPQARPVVRRPKVLEPSRACGCRKRCRHMRPGQICGSSRRVPASPATPRQGPERLRYRRYTTGPAAADPRRLLLGSVSRYILGTTSRDHESCPASWPPPGAIAVHSRLSGLDLYSVGACSVLARMRRYGPAGPGIHVTLPRGVAVQLRMS